MTLSEVKTAEREAIKAQIANLSDTDYLTLRQEAESVVSRNDYENKAYVSLSEGAHPYGQLRWAAQMQLPNPPASSDEMKRIAQLIIERSGIDADTLIAIYTVYENSLFRFGPHNLKARWYDLTPEQQNRIAAGGNWGTPIEPAYAEYVRRSISK